MPKTKLEKRKSMEWARRDRFVRSVMRVQEASGMVCLKAKGDAPFDLVSVGKFGIRLILCTLDEPTAAERERVALFEAPPWVHKMVTWSSTGRGINRLRSSALLEVSGRGRARWSTV